MPFPKNTNMSYLVKFLTVSFIISALYGFLIKWSKLFPYLQMYYYDKLGVVRSMYHDGISGLIVQLTLFIIIVL
jgi:sterol desaturase/sphingolipid hydroxylase (fatty acid hydroxylase superfamily)